MKIHTYNGEESDAYRVPFPPLLPLLPFSVHLHLGEQMGVVWSGTGLNQRAQIEPEAHGANVNENFGEL